MDTRIMMMMMLMLFWQKNLHLEFITRPGRIYSFYHGIPGVLSCRWMATVAQMIALASLCW